MAASLRHVARQFARSGPASVPAVGASALPSRWSGGVAQHRNTPDNTVDTYFDFTEENYQRVNKILGKYPSNFKQSGIIPLLDLAQRQHGGWLPVAAMDKVAKIVGVAPMRVYEVATFYTMFNREKRGKYFIQLCGTTPCMINGSEDIKKTIMEHLNIEDGGTSKDGLFSLLEVRTTSRSCPRLSQHRARIPLLPSMLLAPLSFSAWPCVRWSAWGRAPTRR